ncbi:MAG TPA: ATP-binding protein [Sphingomonas sp.]|jgi:signal transduction histidine kinase/CheY-like chemotaxis protein|nr:ATP-binding protein [Sphingomonas sp.]
MGLAIATGAIAALIVIALIALLNISIRERDAAIARQQSTYEVMILARQLNASISESEAVLGRFVISGKEKGANFGRLYFDRWRLAGAEIEALDRAIYDPPTQDLINRLRQVYAARGQELAAVALRTNYGQNAQALSLYYDAGRSDNVVRISQLLDAIVANERQLLDTRTDAAALRIGRSNSVTTALSLFGGLIAVGAMLLAWRLLEAQREREDEESRSAELEVAVMERTAELRHQMIEREAAEEKLRQAQKLEAIGQLTGGIAHDFNNMLAVVVGGIDVARRRLPRGNNTVREPLDNAMEGAERAAALTRRLLGFARAEPMNSLPTDAGVVIADMMQLLDRVIGDTIRVSIERADGLWPVIVDRHQFENAILNLAVNARDAMPGGGSLVLSTANVTRDIGDFVRVAVQDTGIGMPPEIVARIFEPFFTTKALNQGTGLGLSQIHGFMQATGGTIEIDSREGEGTLVALLFPRGDGMIEAAGGSESVPTANPTSRQILVIEDDTRVLAATVAALEELGHRPIPCGEPRNALATILKHSDADLVISDVMMPDMTGPEIRACALAERPGLPFLFVTGFAEEEAVDALQGAQVLRKPFTVAALGNAIEAALNAAPSELGPAPSAAAA